MAESDSETPTKSLHLPRACDNCRSRKIRCDKLSPCSTCRTAGIRCHTSDRPVKESRNRVLISNQYEEKIVNISAKIDAMENRLLGIEQLLQQIVANQTSSHSSSVTTKPTVIAPTHNILLGRADLNTDGADHGNHFEGESSLTAHSKQAHRTLESLLGQNFKIRNDPNVAAALSNLQGMMQSHGSPRRNNLRFPSANSGSGKGAEQLQPLPPFPVVMDLVQLVKESGSQSVLAWFFFIDFDVEQFGKDCNHFYEAPNSCSVAQKVTVYSGLYSLFSGHPLIIEHAPDKTDPSGVMYRTYAERCRTNLENCLLSFPMILPPTLENITALAIGSSHAIMVAEFSLCWTLTCTAARLCQSLGWHHGIVADQDDSKEAEIKKGLFWTIYNNDKCLSLRLGVSPTFQGYDVALELPKAPADPRSHAWSSFMRITIEIATLHGLIYERLYSPGSSSNTAQDPSFNIQQLSQRIQDAAMENDEVLRSPYFQRAYMKMLGEANEVVLNCLLTLVYRKMPATNANSTQSLVLSAACIHAARAAMQSHQRAIKTLQAASKELWAEYFNWTVLNCPFTPFMVIFCNVVTTLDQVDLKLLEDFVTSIRGPAHGSSDAIIRFHQLCDGFYKLAKHYVAASLRDLTSVVPRKRGASSLLDNESEDSSIQSVGLASDPTLYDPGDNWLLSGSFEEWLMGDPQSMEFLGGDWPAFGTL